MRYEKCTVVLQFKTMMSGYRKSILLGFMLFGLVVLLAVATFFISLGKLISILYEPEFKYL